MLEVSLQILGAASSFRIRTVSDGIPSASMLRPGRKCYLNFSLANPDSSKDAVIRRRRRDGSRRRRGARPARTPSFRAEAAGASRAGQSCRRPDPRGWRAGIASRKGSEALSRVRMAVRAGPSARPCELAALRGAVKFPAGHELGLLGELGEVLAGRLLDRSPARIAKQGTVEPERSPSSGKNRPDRPGFRPGGPVRHYSRTGSSTLYVPVRAKTRSDGPPDRSWTTCP